MSAGFRVLGLLAALAVTATACAPSIEYGVKPNTQNLARLTVSESGPSEILKALGQPRGKGVARWAGIPGPREIWYYEHVKTDGSHLEQTMLLVFVKDGRYDGHLWFSAAQVVQQEAR
jgi:hypothetical protein